MYLFKFLFFFFFNIKASTNVGVDDDAFMNAFEAVPKIQVKFQFFHSSQLFSYFFSFIQKKIYSAKDVDQHMSQTNDCLADLNNDWEKLVDSLKRICSVIAFFSGLKSI